MGSKITVPLDGSYFSEGALRYALSMADATGGSVELLSSYVPDPVVAGYELSAEGRLANLQEYHETLKKKLSENWDVPVQGSVTTGAPGDAVVNHINEAKPDLVVMTTHGRGPTSRFWMGSVADRVVRGATSPILLIRPSEDDSRATDERWNVDRILVALDGSKRAEGGLAMARKLGKELKAELTLIHVLPQPVVVSAYLPHEIRDTRAAAEASKKAAEDYFAQLAPSSDVKEETVIREVGTGSAVASSIVNYGAENDIDLIVITTHGRGKVARMLLGSVADKVIRESDNPVLVVRAKED